MAGRRRTASGDRRQVVPRKVAELPCKVAVVPRKVAVPPCKVAVLPRQEAGFWQQMAPGGRFSGPRARLLAANGTWWQVFSGSSLPACGLWRFCGRFPTPEEQQRERPQPVSPAPDGLPRPRHRQPVVRPAPGVNPPTGRRPGAARPASRTPKVADWPAGRPATRGRRRRRRDTRRPRPRGGTVRARVPARGRTIRTRGRFDETSRAGPGRAGLRRSVRSWSGLPTRRLAHRPGRGARRPVQPVHPVPGGPGAAENPSCTGLFRLIFNPPVNRMYQVRKFCTASFQKRSENPSQLLLEHWLKIFLFLSRFLSLSKVVAIDKKHPCFPNAHPAEWRFPFGAWAQGCSERSGPAPPDRTGQDRTGLVWLSAVGRAGDVRPVPGLHRPADRARPGGRRHRTGGPDRGGRRFPIRSRCPHQKGRSCRRSTGQKNGRGGDLPLVRIDSNAQTVTRQPDDDSKSHMKSVSGLSMRRGMRRAGRLRLERPQDWASTWKHADHGCD